MGKKGGGHHLKRKSAPAFWPIHRKEALWTVKPDPGPHPMDKSIPLVLIVRDMLGLAETRSEARTIISGGNVTVDGEVRKEELFPSGLMDVISIARIQKSFRVMPSEKGLILHAIDKDEEKFKLCRIENKKTLDGGDVQLNLHDGRNLVVKVKDSNKSEEEDVFKTFDTVKISLPDQEIQSHLKLAEGVPALIVGGKNIGRHGRISAIETRQAQKRKSLVTIEDSKGERLQTTIEYVFVIGDTTPHVSLPEVA